MLFFVPCIYFWRRGYLQHGLKKGLFGMGAFGLTQGFIGWWMVASGLKNKKETGEVDKAPRVSPYRLATHAGFAYTLYAMTFWQALNCLRRPAEYGVTL